METKFNSQICTTREQSERLLTLGLKKETADMGLCVNIPLPVEDWKNYDDTVIDIPAWSLHRLIEMRLAHDMLAVFQLSQTDDAFEKIIAHIEWLIKEGIFNKEYLEE